MDVQTETATVDPAIAAEAAQPAIAAERKATVAAIPPAPAGAKDTLWVLDSTAIPGKGPREHQQIVIEHGHKVTKSFKFEPGVARELPFAIAMKFLAVRPGPNGDPPFKLCNDKGEVQPFSRQPKQPDELGPNEKFVLTNEQTVAHYDELTNWALLQRAIELPGGEVYQHTRERKVLIEFIRKTTIARRKANEEKDPRRARAAPAAVDMEDDDAVAPGLDSEME